MTVTRHTITAELPYPIGSADDRDQITVKADITYNCQPDQEGGVCFEVLAVTPLEMRFGGEPFDNEIMTELAYDWLYGEGCQAAIDRATRERNGE